MIDVGCNDDDDDDEDEDEDEDDDDDDDDEEEEEYEDDYMANSGSFLCHKISFFPNSCLQL